MRKTPHHRLRGTAGAAEADQSVAEQHDSPDVAILPILGVVEAIAALESEPTIVLATQAHAGRVHRLVQPLHASSVAGIAPDLGGTLRGRARRGEREEGDDAHNH